METIPEISDKMDNSQVRSEDVRERRREHRERSISLPQAYSSQLELFAAASLSPDPQLMGSLVRRKKMASIPIHLESPFFNPPVAPEEGSFESDQMMRRPRRQKNGDAFSRVLKRKQVSLDVMHPAHASFFGKPTNTIEELEDIEDIEDLEEYTEEKGQVPGKKLFFPIVFSKPAIPLKGGGYEPPLESSSRFDTDEMKRFFQTQSDKCKGMESKIRSLIEALKVETTKDPELISNLISSSNEILQDNIEISENRQAKENEILGKDLSQLDQSIDDGDEANMLAIINRDIVRATRFDYIYAVILAVLMIVLTGVIVGWHTEIDENSVIYGSVGLACSTPCFGNIHNQDFFHGRYSFEGDEILDLEMYLDPAPLASNKIENISSEHRNLGENIAPSVRVEIVSLPNKVSKANITFGTPDPHERTFFSERVFVSEFNNPEEDHVINIFNINTDGDDVMTFTLAIHILAPIAKQSVLIAALIMLIVYVLILLEVLHRTLIAIFGSMVALFFFFLMREGHAESIGAVMLNMEWSTLGLLFGMMIIVGEMSQTGVFEWCAVRILLSSKGSFNRLFVLLGLLTALSSAFLDNVTTMLLLAPVTIDMCKILEVDPRPFLIGEVILSNIGGTATLIGDPPNIIIGSSFDEIGFVDFIIYIAPAIVFLCTPASVIAILWIYRHYFNGSKMKDLDSKILKHTYPIYDEPRLMISGTVAFFVILIFFLHPLHHKDTAWIALLGAFLTMAFTSPHDVHHALKNHIEWDTLLFFGGLFVLVEICAEMGLLEFIGEKLAIFISNQEEENQLPIAITLILWVSAVTSAFLDNIPYTTTMIPVVKILADQLPTLPVKTLAWALSFGACLGGNGTLLGASANIVTAGIATNKGYKISFINFFYPGFIVMILTVAISNIYMLVIYVWA